MVAPNRRSRILTLEKEEIIENFTEISSTIYDKEDITKDFERNFTSWFEEFSLEWKRFEFIKSQAMLHLILSYIFQILTIAILIACFLETFTKFEKSYALLGIGFYLAVVAINFIYDTFIKYFLSEDDYITEVKQYFESVLEMLQLFKRRLDVLRKRCDWDVKLSSFLDIKSKYASKDTVYASASLSSSAFLLYNLCGIAIGIITSLLCQYFEFQIFPVLKFSTMCLLFAIIAAKYIKIHTMRNLKKSMKKVTENFLNWFENNCELFKILQRNKSSIDDLFSFRSLHICRKPTVLNAAIGITACAVIAGLNITRNDFKNAFMFIGYGVYSVLFKHTVKIKKTEVVEESSKKDCVEQSCQPSPSHGLSRNLYRSKGHIDYTVNNTVKMRYKVSHKNALCEDVDCSEKYSNYTGDNAIKERHQESRLDVLDNSKELSNNTIMSRYKREKDNKKSISSENESHIHFSNESINAPINHMNEKRISFSETETNISATTEEMESIDNFDKDIILNDNSDTSIKLADPNNKLPTIVGDPYQYEDKDDCTSNDEAEWLEILSTEEDLIQLDILETSRASCSYSSGLDGLYNFQFPSDYHQQETNNYLIDETSVNLKKRREAENEYHVMYA